jgi:hypothetical protein
MRRYPHTVTFQAATKSQTGSGQEVVTWADVDELSDLRALVIAATSETTGDRMVLDRDLYQIIVEGDRAIEVAMSATTDYATGTFGVIRVVRPVAPMPDATIVTAERVTT